MGFRQAHILLIVALLIPMPARAAAPPSGKYAKQLAAECDALMLAAIRRPYGWGWDTVPPAAGARSNTPRHIEMNPLGTPAAGLLLLWSGQLLDEVKYRQAALDAARGMSSAISTTGQIPLHAMFAGAAGGRDEPSPVPDRAATRAGLVLLASVLDANDPKPPELLSRSAQRLAQWMMRQQADDGGWPTAHQYTPEGETRPITLRIIRLDNSDYRDNTFTMLLAGQILDDRAIKRSATRSALKIVNLRMGIPPIQPTTAETPDNRSTTQPEQPPTEPLASILTDPGDLDRRTNGLWSTAYRMNGALDANLTDFPPGADTVASRYAIQTVLGAYLAIGDRQHGQALDLATQAITQLRDTDGVWKKKYLRTPTTAPTTQEAGGAFAPQPIVPRTSDFGLPPVLNAVRQLKLMRRDRYNLMLNEQIELKQQLAATVCGLMDQPFTLELPVTKAEVETYIKGHARDFDLLNGPVPDVLDQRLKRLWILFIRAKLEQMAAGS